MSVLLRGIRSITRVQHAYNNLLDQYHARGLVVMCWASFVLALIGMLYELSVTALSLTATHIGPITLDSSGAILVIIFALSAFTLVGCLLLVNQGLLAGASAVFILFLFTVSLIAYIPNGTTSFTMFAFSLPIVAAALLLDRRSMVVMIVLTALTLVGTILLDNAGFLANITIGAPSLSDSLFFGLLIMTADGLMLIVFGGGPYLLHRRNIVMREELRSLTTLRKSLAEATDTNEILLQVIELIRDRLGYYHVQAFLVDEVTNILTLRAGTSMDRGQLNLTPKRAVVDENDILLQVMRKGRSERITLNDLASSRTEFLPTTKAEMIVPLHRGDVQLGLLDVQSLNGDAFQASEVELLETIGAQITLLLQNVRSQSKLGNLDEERRQLAGKLETMTQQFQQLKDEVTGQAWHRFLEKRDTHASGFDWSSNGIQPNSTLTPGLERGMRMTIPELITQSGEQILSVPIILGNQVLGVMEFRSPVDKMWNNRSIDLARAISQRLALALDNIRLFDQAQVTAAREQIASQIGAELQTRTELEALLSTAGDAFQRALGATRTTIRLGEPQRVDAVTVNNQANPNGGY